MRKKEIQSDEAPAAVGAYSQGQQVGELIFTSGQIALHPDSGELVTGSFREEARQVLENLLAVVKAGEGSRESIVKTTVYLTDLSLYDELNEIYSDYFAKSLPARSVVEVKALPRGVNLEIEAIATK